jgi:hypothetical protein
MRRTAIVIVLFTIGLWAGCAKSTSPSDPSSSAFVPVMEADIEAGQAMDKFLKKRPGKETTLLAVMSDGIFYLGVENAYVMPTMSTGIGMSAMALHLALLVGNRTETPLRFDEAVTEFKANDKVYARCSNICSGGQVLTFMLSKAAPQDDFIINPEEAVVLHVSSGDQNCSVPTDVEVTLKKDGMRIAGPFTVHYDEKVKREQGRS